MRSMVFSALLVSLVVLATTLFSFSQASQLQPDELARTPANARPQFGHVGPRVHASAGTNNGPTGRAPAITGIPELVIADKTGFLYEPGSMWDFLEKVMEISCLLGRGPHLMEDMQEKRSTGNALNRTIPVDSAVRLDWVRHAARVQICCNFNRQKNLQSFTDLFFQHAFRFRGEAHPHASSVLQQI